MQELLDLTCWLSPLITFGGIGFGVVITEMKKVNDVWQT